MAGPRDEDAGSRSFLHHHSRESKTYFFLFQALLWKNELIFMLEVSLVLESLATGFGAAETAVAAGRF